MQRLDVRQMPRKPNVPCKHPGCPALAPYGRYYCDKHAYLLCLFVQEAGRDDLAQTLQNDYHKVLFLEYQPEPTNDSVNAKQYKIMIADYIAGV